MKKEKSNRSVVVYNVNGDTSQVLLGESPCIQKWREKPADPELHFLFGEKESSS